MRTSVNLTGKYEKRPMLMVIQPYVNETTGEVFQVRNFLAAHFEVVRVKLLGMPFEEKLNFVPWEEH